VLVAPYLYIKREYKVNYYICENLFNLYILILYIHLFICFTNSHVIVYITLLYLYLMTQPYDREVVIFLLSDERVCEHKD
jgi:hypothetical protein